MSTLRDGLGRLEYKLDGCVLLLKSAFLYCSLFVLVGFIVVWL